MKIAVIGASGNAGSRITAELASRGQSVTAMARHPEKIARGANVIPARADAADEAGLDERRGEFHRASDSCAFCLL